MASLHPLGLSLVFFSLHNMLLTLKGCNAFVIVLKFSSCVHTINSQQCVNSMLLVMLPRKGLIVSRCDCGANSSQPFILFVDALRCLHLSKSNLIFCVCVCVLGGGRVGGCHSAEKSIWWHHARNRQTNRLDWRKEANNEPRRAISSQMSSRTQRKVNSSELAVHPLRIQYYTYHPPILSVSYTIQASLPDSMAPAQIKVFFFPLPLWFHSRAAASLSCDSHRFSHNKRPLTQTGG